MTPNSMLAAVLQAPRQVRVLRVPRPEPGPGEVLVRIEGCGLCGSNIPPWQGRPWFDYPFEPGLPGHEGWGVVEAVGRGVESIDAGTRVASLGLRSFAEYEAVPETKVVPIGAAPASLFPGEALACACNVFERSSIAAGDSVAVIGVGFLGATLLRLASDRGARTIAVSRRPFALEVARTMGADHVVALDDVQGAARDVLSLQTGGCDVVIEAAGVQQTLDLASEVVREEGRLVIAGYHQDGLRTIDLQSWNWRALEVVNAHERDGARIRGALERAVALTEEGALEPDRLVTHVLPIPRIEEAFQLLEERPAGFLKAAVAL